MQQTALVEKMIDMVPRDPAQWHNVARGQLNHKLVGRQMDEQKRTLEVVGLSRILGPAMMVRDPVGIDSQNDTKVH